MDWALVGEYTGVVLALLLIEAVLSFDNAAILAAMVRRLEPADRRKALFYGLLGAYGLRISVILIASWLIDNQWVKFIGGGYLIFLFLKHAVDFVRHKAGHDVPDIQNWKIFTRLGIPMFVATIIQIELMDLAFALDQVLAAVAFVETYPDPDRYILIIISSVIGIAMLRIAATQIVKVMDWMPTLEHIAYIAVGYVGVKLILTYDGFNPAHGGIHIPNAISIGITLGLFVIPILIKLIFKWPKSHEIAP